MEESRLKKRLERTKEKVAILEKLLEEKTREAFLSAEEARESYKSLTRIFSAIPDPLIVTDSHLTIQDCNDMVLTKFGYDRDGFVGQKLSDFVISSSRDWKDFCVEDVSKSTESEIVRNADGSSTPVMISVSHASQSAHDEAYIFILKDISLRLELEKEREQAKQRLEQQVQERTRDLELAKVAAEQANEAKSLFLANMSHEIRTPLNALSGIISLLLKDTLTPSVTNNIQKLKIASDSLLGIVNNILDFTKIETGELEVETIQFDLSKLMSDLEALFHVAAKKKGIALKFYVENGLNTHRCGDMHRMRQVMTNLISNAIKFTSEGSVIISLDSAATEAEPDTIAISVVDTGVGIDPQKVDSIFDPFTQEDESTTRVFGGTGLGLSICKHIVERLGGTIRCQSIKGSGSTFQVIMPLESVDDSVAVDSKPSSVGGLPQTRILIVEDNEMNQDVMGMVLEKLGQKYTIKGNGLLGLEEATQAKYDMIFMDCQMPVMDGFTAAENIRSHELSINKKTPIIAMTANALKAMKERCLSSGMDDYVTKPLTIGKVTETIVKWAPVDCAESQDPKLDSEPQLETVSAPELGEGDSGDNQIIDWAIIDDLEFLSSPKENYVEQQVGKFLAVWQSYECEIKLVEVPEELANKTHKFKTSCGIVGARQAVSRCAEMEKLARAYEIDQFWRVLDQLRQDVEHARTELQKYLAKKVA
ncbi:PAS domain-containing hybrid sensor histidine kinase/response regulator [Pseudobacteriovorax antillogorgiicola]|uniref:histidine kinase n=1 Tax=Pseudobacteriovorax antillogorgiicola TaxID=1513793 RepID=A0A1Y6CLU3_9BACT|nr:PAS domain-containing hybrid sensor histidine kinase/response regulator [Pseudobacteriovorax antillogorgiicola]TCS47345.1 PAS domain S-box-containing protein [Pseudobacteriovorax antillogorgiicola]SMF63198.1 PAS domain S-box-containing protein [Pseudobacteriovorax antillogorgiicola]